MKHHIVYATVYFPRLRQHVIHVKVLNTRSPVHVPVFWRQRNRSPAVLIGGYRPGTGIAAVGKLHRAYRGAFEKRSLYINGNTVLPGKNCPFILVQIYPVGRLCIGGNLEPFSGYMLPVQLERKPVIARGQTGKVKLPFKDSIPLYREFNRGDFLVAAAVFIIIVVSLQHRPKASLRRASVHRPYYAPKAYPIGWPVKLPVKMYRAPVVLMDCIAVIIVVPHSYHRHNAWVSPWG